MKVSQRSQKYQSLTLKVVLSSFLMLVSHDVFSGAREQAKRIHERIAGVPPSATVLNDMETDIATDDATNNPLTAAFMAIENDAFYDVTLKNLAAPWTNEAMSSFVPLNDYTATVIGLVRDDEDFRKLLYDNVIYVGDPALGLTGYSNANNTHFEELEEGGHSLKDNLVRRTQTEVSGLPSEATAGIMTTRAAARAFFSAGTNRAMFRFTMLNHLCNDMEQVADITRTPDRIRQDVSRSPGGDSRIFLNSCVGCHSGMDPMAQAFAYYDYEYDADNDPDGENGQMVFNTGDDPDTGSRVQAKYLINPTNFEYGFITPDENWENYWRHGQNKLLGWDDTLTGSGSGAKSMGQELSHSEAFAECQVRKVFKTVCLREPEDHDLNDHIEFPKMVTSFKDNNYNLKQVFAETAVHCMGD